jgi:hypothetical protein
VFASLPCPQGPGAGRCACRAGVRCARGRDLYGLPSRTSRSIGRSLLCGPVRSLPRHTPATGTPVAGGQGGWLGGGSSAAGAGQRTWVLPTVCCPIVVKRPALASAPGTSGAGRVGACGSGGRAGGAVRARKGSLLPVKAGPSGPAPGRRSLLRAPSSSAAAKVLRRVECVPLRPVLKHGPRSLTC